MDRPPFSSAFTSRTAQVRRALAGLGWAWLLLSVVLAWLDREGRWIEPGREGVVLLKLWIFWAVWAVLPWWGAALLGLKVGSTIHWELPGGASTHLEVLELLYQPEAAGEFHR